MNGNSQSLYTMFLLYTMPILLNTSGHPLSACGFTRSPFYYGENSRRAFVVFNPRIQIDTDEPYYITCQPRLGLSPQSSNSPHTKGGKKNNGILTPEALNLREKHTPTVLREIVLNTKKKKTISIYCMTWTFTKSHITLVLRYAKFL